MKKIIIFLLTLIPAFSFCQKFKTEIINDQTFIVQKDTLAIVQEDTLSHDGIYIETKIPLGKFSSDFIEKIFLVQSKITRKEAEIASIQKDIEELNKILMKLQEEASIIMEAGKK